MLHAAKVTTRTIALFCTVLSCGSPTSPTASVTVLTVEPRVTALKTGQTVSLSAVEQSGDGTQRTVIATWSTDAADVIDVNPAGVATARGVGTATISAAAAGRTASLRVQSVPDAAGTWSGETIDSESTHVAGAGPFRPTTGLVRPISLDLQQDGGSVAGNGVIDLTPGPVHGTMTVEGQLTLSGTFENSDGFHAEITEWSTDLDSTGNRLTGRFTITQRFTNVFGPQVILQKCSILSLTRAR